MDPRRQGVGSRTAVMKVISGSRWETQGRSIALGMTGGAE